MYRTEWKKLTTSWKSVDTSETPGLHSSSPQGIALRNCHTVIVILRLRRGYVVIVVAVSFFEVVGAAPVVIITR